MDHEHAETSSPISHPIFSPGPSPFDAQTWSPMPNEVGPSTLFATPTAHQPTTTTLAEVPSKTLLRKKRCVTSQVTST
ncbi:unnamed protein product [Closterium sp. Naga37s-1]|nr:unnamed protein product [Closterium sp. Naga37s-1]